VTSMGDTSRSRERKTVKIDMFGSTVARNAWRTSVVLHLEMQKSSKRFKYSKKKCECSPTAQVEIFPEQCAKPITPPTSQTWVLQG
jgi:hypothetical protein